MISRLGVAALCLLTFGGCTLKDDSAPPPDASASGPKPLPAPPDVAAPPADALRTPSGVASRVLRVGLGSSHPTTTSTVQVHYTGWTTDGMMFDSSVSRGAPITMPLSQFIPGWVEGVQLMVVGEKRRFWIPGNLAYDSDPRPDVPKGTLVFDIELLAIR